MKPLEAVHHGKKLDLKDVATDDTGPYKDKKEALEAMAKDLDKITELQEPLYAESKRSLLIVIQGMDTSGKDGVVKKVVGALNPAGARVTSWKAPTSEELAHDFLWRIHKETPSKGRIAVFNRSHYEDVLIVKVHGWIDEKACQGRYKQIRNFERALAAAGTTVLKFYLHISKEEQKKRLEDRLKDKTKIWKFNPNDLKEREFWKDYRKAYEDALSETSLENAPWFIVPADHKWYRDAAIARTLRDAMEKMKPQYPPEAKGLKGLKIV